jgi:hypothetical protein
MTIQEGEPLPGTETLSGEDVGYPEAEEQTYLDSLEGELSEGTLEDLGYGSGDSEPEPEE